MAARALLAHVYFLQTSWRSLRECLSLPQYIRNMQITKYPYKHCWFVQNFKSSTGWDGTRKRNKLVTRVPIPHCVNIRLSNNTWARWRNCKKNLSTAKLFSSAELIHWKGKENTNYCPQKKNANYCPQCTWL